MKALELFMKGFEVSFVCIGWVSGIFICYAIIVGAIFITVKLFERR